MAVGVVLAEVELALEELAHLVGDVVADLEADGSAELAAAQLDLDGRQQVLGLLLLEGEVGVAAHAEGGRGLHLHPGEQLAEVRGDHLLERDEPLAIGHHHEPRQEVGHLDAGEAPLGGDRIAEQHREVQREVRDVRERVPGVDGERREHREDALLEGLDEELLVVVVEVVPPGEAHAVVGQRRDDLVEEQPLLSVDEDLHALAHLDQLLAGGAPVRRGGAEPGGHLLLEAGHADLEELVEVLAEDGQELGPLEQRHRVVGGQGEHPLVEVEPGELAVEVAGCVGVARRGGPRPVARRRRPWPAERTDPIRWPRMAGR